MKKFKLFYIVIAIVLTLALTISGCQRETEPDPDPVPPAEDPQDDPQDEEGRFTDGEYTAELEPDARGWRAIIRLVVEGGEITEAEFDELNEDDESKLENEDYIQRWEEAADVDAIQAVRDYEEQLIETQDPDAIDVISGATSTHEKFVEVVKAALEDAE